MPDRAIDLGVAQALARVPFLAAHPAATWRVAPLDSLTNHVWRVTGPGGDFVLRLANPAPYLDRAREAHNHRLAAALKLAPPILFEDAASGLMVTVFLKDHQPFDRAADRRAAIAAVGHALGRLHYSGAAFQGEMRLAPTLNHYLDIAGIAGASVAAIWQRVRSEVEPVLERLERHLVPSHVDPVPANILLSNVDTHTSVHFIDWEYSAPATGVWDLADFSIEAGLTAMEDDALLAAYASQQGRVSIAAFALYKAMLDLLAAAWAASQTALPGARAAHDDMIPLRLARSCRVLDASDFAALVAKAGA
ncbi:MAG: choline/ethanolamine kinase family protein [Dongiaceae bacterium]